MDGSAYRPFSFAIFMKSTKLPYIIVCENRCITICQAAEKKKSRWADDFSRPNELVRGGFEFQSRRFFLLVGNLRRP